MSRAGRTLAAFTVGCLLLVAAVNVTDPPGPDDGVSAHARAIHRQDDVTALGLAMGHGNSKVQHDYGTYLMIGRVTGNGTLTVHEGMFGEDHTYEGLARVVYRVDRHYDHEIDDAQLDALLEVDHREGMFADDQLSREPPTTDWVLVGPAVEEQRGGAWRSVTHGDTVLIAPEEELQRVGVEWQ